MMSIDPESYFTDYENLEVHELMLRDRPRQSAYYNAITRNPHIFKDKIVLDVGAGTGILSAFCARAGARVVYAVEASNLAKIALNVIEENDLTSVVKVIHSKIEDFVLPASADKADVLVSEWMGFYLLHEGMLDSVIYARDNLLKQDGVMFPSEAVIYVSPCAVPSRFDDWKVVDTIRMTRFASELRKQKQSKPEIIEVKDKDLLHEGVVFFWMNLSEITMAELEEITFKEVLATQVAGKFQGFCIWFECQFPDTSGTDVVLSTAPSAPVTHWKQCVIVLPENSCEDLEAKSPIAFKLTMKRHANDQRKYNMEMELLDPNKEDHPVPCPCHMTKCILTEAHLRAMDTS